MTQPKLVPEHDGTLVPAAVCARYGISRSTLLRWEKRRLISAAPRTYDNERRYTADQLSEIEKLCEARTGSMAGEDLKSQRPFVKIDVLERLCVSRLLGDKGSASDIADLRGLAFCGRLQERSIRLLAEDALRRQVGDTRRTVIWDFLRALDEDARSKADARERAY